MSASFYVSLSVKALFKHNDKTIDTHLLWCWKHIYYLQLWQGFGQLQNSRALLLIIFLHLQLQLQCTMGQAVEIDSLEVHKSKQILHAHLWSENYHSFCKWCKTTKVWTSSYFSHLNISAGERQVHVSSPLLFPSLPKSRFFMFHIFLNYWNWLQFFCLC